MAGFRLGFTATMARHLPILVVPLLLVLAAPGNAAPDAGPGASTRLTTLLRDVQGRTVGRVTLTESTQGVVVQGNMIGLPKGVHAIHFHETGKCEPPFKTAGGHFNPTHKAHGMFDPGGRHAGDLPNIVVSKDGTADFEAFVEGVSLSPGPSTLLDADGTAIVLHARADDYRSQPAGDSGDRIACGVVGQ